MQMTGWPKGCSFLIMSPWSSVLVVDKAFKSWTWSETETTKTSSWVMVPKKNNNKIIGPSHMFRVITPVQSFCCTGCLFAAQCSILCTSSHDGPWASNTRSCRHNIDYPIIIELTDLRLPPKEWIEVSLAQLLRTTRFWLENNFKNILRLASVPISSNYQWVICQLWTHSSSNNII